MSAPSLAGKWRITETDTWNQDYLDLVEPAFIEFVPGGSSEFRFGVVTASLDCSYDKTKTEVHFDWNGCDEGDQVSGDGWAEIDETGILTGEIMFDNGDETSFKARRWGSHVFQQPARAQSTWVESSKG
jgi:hypothetical protein